MVVTNFERTPAAVVYAHSTPDVQAAVKCAYNNGVRVSQRNLQGATVQHSWLGWPSLQRQAM
jgi:FAD/FMN-containing dehydrogenase